MAATRLVVSIFVVVGLLAAACGSDDDTTSSKAETASRPTATGSQEGSTTSQERPEGAIEPDIASDAGTASMEAGTPSDEAAQEPPDAVAASEQEKVQLGLRFIWCPSVQATWERYDDALAALTQARADIEAAAGELRRAEAREALEEADEDFQNEAHLRRDNNLSYLLYQTLQSSRGGREDTQNIAYALAWEALVDADPEIGDAIGHAWSGDAAQELAAAIDWDLLYEASFGYLNRFSGWPDPDIPADLAAQHADQLAEAFKPGRTRGHHGVRITVGENVIFEEANDAARYAISVLEDTDYFKKYSTAYATADIAFVLFAQGSAGYSAFKQSFQESCQE